MPRIFQNLGAVERIPDTSSVDVGPGAIFQLNPSETIDALTGTGFVQPTVTNQTLIIGANNGSGTFNGVIRNTGPLMLKTDYNLLLGIRYLF